MKKVALKWKIDLFTCSDNVCFHVQESNDGLAGELEEAYMLSRIVSL